MDGYHPDELVGRLTRISANRIQGDVVLLDTQIEVIEGNEFISAKITVVRGLDALVVGNERREGRLNDATIEVRRANTVIVGNTVWGGILVDGIAQSSGNKIDAGSIPAIETAGYGARISNNTILGGTPGILARGKTEIVGNYLSPRTVAIDTSQTFSVGTVLASGQVTTPALLAGTISSSGAANIEGNLHVQGEAKSVVSGVEYFMVPKGGVILWSGATTNIPSGWRLCDGARCGAGGSSRRRSGLPGGS